MNSKITIEVPLVPPSPNVMKRKYKHFQAYKRLRENWEKTIFFCTALHQRNQLHNWNSAYKMRLLITIHHEGKERDPDNLQASPKVVIDALKNINFLHDDSGEWLEVAPIAEVNSVLPRESKTVIELEPIWDEAA